MKTILVVILFSFAIFSACACTGGSQGKDKEAVRPNVTVREVAVEDNVKAGNTANGLSIQNNGADDTQPTEYTMYTVNLDVDPESRSIKAVEKIKYINNTRWELDKIYINLPLDAFKQDSTTAPFFPEFKDTVYKYGLSYSQFDIIALIVNNENADYEIDGVNLAINLREPLAPGSTIDIAMQFEAVIPKIAHRTGANDHAQWFGNFLPAISAYDSRKATPYPYYKAGRPFYYDISKYDVTVTTPNSYIVYGTGIEVITENEGKKITSFETKIVRDFAFAVSDEYITDTAVTKDGVTVNFVHYSDINPDKILEDMITSLEYFNDIVGSYPYRAIDLVETELFLEGSQAYPGIIFADSGLLSKKNNSLTIAGGVGRQWFYNIVGVNQVKEPWLNEGLVQLLRRYALFSEDEVETQMETVRKSHENAESTGLKRYDLSVFNNWSEYTKYTEIASIMFYDLRLMMGDEKFNQFLKEYFNKYSYKTSDAFGLTQTAEDVYDGDLRPFFNKWLWNS